MMTMNEENRAKQEVKPNYTAVHFIHTQFKIKQNNDELLLGNSLRETRLPTLTHRYET